MPQDFDTYIKQSWPKNVPKDCSRLKNGVDCLERNKKHLCWSCRTYAKLSARFELLPK